MKLLKSIFKAIAVFVVILTGNILVFTIFLMATVGFIAGAFWLAIQTLENPYLYIPIDLLFIAALIIAMRTKTFRKGLSDFLDQVKQGL